MGGTIALHSAIRGDAVRIVCVTDGSCFVTNGTVGPSLTIMALTARACEHLAREHATGALNARSGEEVRS